VGVILVSGVNSRSADIVVDGLSKGAEEFIQKPDGASIDENRAQLKRQLTEVFTAIRARSHGRFAAGQTAVRRRAPEARPVAPPVTGPKPGPFTIVGIGVSTGGPQALGEIIPQLPAGLRVPIVIVQHMPPIFTASLARSLDRRSQVRVSEAVHGQELEPGHVYVSPGGIHMVVSVGPDRLNPRYHTMLVDGAPVNSCKPSVDVMFQSLAAASGKATLSVMMTGMGQDGLVGVQHIRRAGGYCLTQSRETCVVYGMPQAVDQANLSNESLALGDLAERIRTLVG
jgi:two-component system chemotaxis response regulator CheB